MRNEGLGLMFRRSVPGIFFGGFAAGTFPLTFVNNKMAVSICVRVDGMKNKVL